jgi:hypothetical protein
MVMGAVCPACRAVVVIGAGGREAGREGELGAVVPVVLGGIRVHLSQGHVEFEVWVPTRREWHRPVQPLVRAPVGQAS